MIIKDIRFSKINSDGDSRGVCGICSVNLDDKVIVHGVKVKRVKGSLRVLLPDRKVTKDGVFKPVVTCLDTKFKDDLVKKVLEQYFNDLARL